MNATETDQHAWVPVEKKSQRLEKSATTLSVLSTDSSINDDERKSAQTHLEQRFEQQQQQQQEGEEEQPQQTTESTMELSEDEQQQRKCACYKKMAIALVLVGVIVLIIIDSLTNGYVRSGVNSFLEWVQENPGPGVVVVALVYFVATVLFVPGSILTLGSGFAFSASFGLGIGLILGTIAVFAGASAGAIVSFILGRYLLRDSVSKLSEKYSIFKALDNAFETKGFRIMVLLRLSPIIPFNAINYIAGISALGFMPYLWSLFAILPGTILYVFLGASASSLAGSATSNDDNTITIIVVVLGVLFGFVAIVLTSYYARQELNKVIEKRRAESNVNSEDDGDEAREEEDDSASEVDIEMASGFVVQEISSDR